VPDVNTMGLEEQEQWMFVARWAAGSWSCVRMIQGLQLQLSFLPQISTRIIQVGKMAIILRLASLGHTHAHKRLGVGCT